MLSEVSTLVNLIKHRRCLNLAKSCEITNLTLETSLTKQIHKSRQNRLLTYEYEMPSLIQQIHYSIDNKQFSIRYLLHYYLLLSFGAWLIAKIS